MLPMAPKGTWLCTWSWSAARSDLYSWQEAKETFAGLPGWGHVMFTHQKLMKT